MHRHPVSCLRRRIGDAERLAAGVSVRGSTITADYAASADRSSGRRSWCSVPGDVLAPGLALGTIVTNTGVVTGTLHANGERQRVDRRRRHPGVRRLERRGVARRRLRRRPRSGERRLAAGPSTSIQAASLLHRRDRRRRRIASSASSRTTPADPYELRFRAPGAPATTGMLGRAASPFTNGLQRITDIIVGSGSNSWGSICRSIRTASSTTRWRASRRRATLTLLDAASGTPVPASCFDDPAQQGQVTLADGYYKFDSTSATCLPSGGDYLIDVTARREPTSRATRRSSRRRRGFDDGVLGADLPASVDDSSGTATFAKCSLGFAPASFRRGTARSITST
jgi:hypothetical protein